MELPYIYLPPEKTGKFPISLGRPQGNNQSKQKYDEETIEQNYSRGLEEFKESDENQIIFLFLRLNKADIWGTKVKELFKKLKIELVKIYTLDFVIVKINSGSIPEFIKKIEARHEYIKETIKDFGKWSTPNKIFSELKKRIHTNTDNFSVVLSTFEQLNEAERTELRNKLEKKLTNDKINFYFNEEFKTYHCEMKSKEIVEYSKFSFIENIRPTTTIVTSESYDGKYSKSFNINITSEEEGMIKTEISVNPEFLDLKIGSKSSDELAIEQALKKREELEKLYQKEGSNVNPLVLIQLPDKKEGMEDKKEEVLKILKNKFNIKDGNGKLAIWLSEDKSDTLPNIEKNNNEVEVLIFKQAIALGWDCPRASILVIFRESKSFTFTIQTIGRIMRMPELKHYTKEPELNKGFVFTNLPDIEITEDYAKDYVTIFEAKRKSEYQNISLHSISLKRQRERTRLSGEFTRIFSSVSSELKLKDKITAKPSKVVSPVISDGKIVNIDKIGEIEHKGTIDIKLTEKELQDRFNRFITDNCTPFAPSDSSDRMKTAIYNFFQKEFRIGKFEPEVQRIVLGKENVQTFVDAINLAKEKFKVRIAEKLSEKRELIEEPKWEVPAIITYTSKYKTKESNLSIMKPLYVRNPSEPELKFMELLEKSNKVKWWFRNGEGEPKYFAVLYQDENGENRGFYIDFMLITKDGRIGLFDTKSGSTAETAGPRAEGLQKYIKEHTKKGKKLWGGIAIYVNGTWRYNDQEKYKYNPNNLSEWKTLEL